jgi:hypothetical protein
MARFTDQYIAESGAILGALDAEAIESLAVIWHLLVWHPALQLATTKWESMATVRA